MTATNTKGPPIFLTDYFSDEYAEFDKIYSSGRFSRWSASLKLCVKF